LAPVLGKGGGEGNSISWDFFGFVHSAEDDKNIMTTSQPISGAH